MRRYQATSLMAWSPFKYNYSHYLLDKHNYLKKDIHTKSKHHVRLKVSAFSSDLLSVTSCPICLLMGLAAVSTVWYLYLQLPAPSAWSLSILYGIRHGVSCFGSRGTVNRLLYLKTNSDSPSCSVAELAGCAFLPGITAFAGISYFTDVC